MDYVIDLSSLSSKSSDLNSSKSNIDNINDMTVYGDSDIDSYLEKINETIKRIKNGYNNASTWLTSYIEDMNTLESNLASLNSANLITPTEFNKEFEDIFSKVTMPAIKTGGNTVANKDLGSLGTPVIDTAIETALAIANDNSHGYSQQNRWGPNYDCSSLVISAYEDAGLLLKESGASYTGNMRSVLTSMGFEWISGNPDVSDLQPGDIVLDENSHTEMYIGDGKLVGAHSNYDGVSGDSSGNEISVKNYYSHPWDGVLRYTGATVVST